MNVTEDVLRDYIALFHQTLEETAQQFLPEEFRRLLLHASLLPARIIGYVSTQFGAGVEYVPFERTEITIVRGTYRVEDLFVQAPRSARDIGPMLAVQEGSGTYLNAGGVFNLTLEGAFPFRLQGPNAGLRLGTVAFRVGSWRRCVEYAEIFGNRTTEFWSRERAISRAKDEVLAGLAQTKRAETRHLSLADYIAKFKERTILLLGDYDEHGTARLESISASLSSLGYDPILIKDLPDLPVQDLLQKVATIGSLSRFVVVDDSSKSGHLAEVQVCRQNNWVTVLLRADGKAGSWMTAGASVTSNVILEQEYDPSNPNESVSTAVNWAETKIAELQRTFDALFPWRI